VCGLICTWVARHPQLTDINIRSARSHCFIAAALLAVMTLVFIPFNL
jgi:hypothetical protein